MGLPRPPRQARPGWAQRLSMEIASRMYSLFAGFGSWMRVVLLYVDATLTGGKPRAALHDAQTSQRSVPSLRGTTGSRRTH